MFTEYFKFSDTNIIIERKSNLQYIIVSIVFKYGST
jgi:hypothetical protein